MVLKPRPSSGDAQVEIAGTGSAARTLIPVPAPDYQVFEVTNLLIPAGTDWSVNAHSIGSFDVDPAQAYIAALYVELETAPAPGGESITLQIITPDNSSGGATATVLGSENVQASAADFSPFAQIGRYGAADHPVSPETFIVGLQTSGPTSADITVVRARAALLVI